MLFWFISKCVGGNSRASLLWTWGKTIFHSVKELSIDYQALKIFNTEKVFIYKNRPIFIYKRIKNLTMSDYTIAVRIKTTNTNETLKVVKIYMFLKTLIICLP